MQQATQGVTSLVGAWLATFDITLAFTLTGIAGVLRGGARAGAARAAAGNERRAACELLGHAASAGCGLPSSSAVRYQVLFGAATSCYPFMITFVALQPYATEVGLPIWALGPLALVMRGGAMVGSLLAHRVSRLVGAPVVIVVAPVTIVVSLALLGLVPSRSAVLLFVVIALANALLRPPLSELLESVDTAAERATVLSLESVVLTGLLAVVEPIVFAVATAASWRWRWGCRACWCWARPQCCSGCGGPLGRRWRSRRRADRRPP